MVPGAEGAAVDLGVSGDGGFEKGAARVRWHVMCEPRDGFVLDPAGATHSEKEAYTRAYTAARSEGFEPPTF